MASLKNHNDWEPVKMSGDDHEYPGDVIISFCEFNNKFYAYKHDIDTMYAREPRARVVQWLLRRMNVLYLEKFHITNGRLVHLQDSTPPRARFMFDSDDEDDDFELVPSRTTLPPDPLADLPEGLDGRILSQWAKGIRRNFANADIVAVSRHPSAMHGPSPTLEDVLHGQILPFDAVLGLAEADFPDQPAQPAAWPLVTAVREDMPDDNCGICQQHFGTRDAITGHQMLVVALSPCKHMIHLACAKIWWKTELRNREACILCRQPLTQGSVAEPSSEEDDLEHLGAGAQDWW